MTKPLRSKYGQTEDGKARRRWINHYRQRRDPPGTAPGSPFGASAEEWQAYVAWVRAFGRIQGEARQGDYAETFSPDSFLQTPPLVGYEAAECGDRRASHRAVD